MIPFSPIERKAAFAAACELKEITKTAGAEKLDISWNHLLACMDGERVPSDALKQRVAEFVGIPVDEFWGSLQPEVAA